MIEKLKNLPITTHYSIQIICWIAGIIIGLVGSQFSMVGSIIGLILMITGFVWHFLFLRCPHCRHSFHVRQPIPKYCPNCGKQVL